MSAARKKPSKPKGGPAKGKAKAKVSKTKKVDKKVAAVERPKKAASKPKKVVEKKEVSVEKKVPPPKTVAKAQPVKMGPPPKAIVAVRHFDSFQERAARGFSFGELSSAGIPLNTAKHQDLSVDIRRRSVVEQNVEALKGWLQHPAGDAASDVSGNQAAAALKKE